jgi:hypothetical protein
MGHDEYDSEVIGRGFFVATVLSAIAFAAAAYWLVS